MDGEVDGTQATGEEQQGVQGDIANQIAAIKNYTDVLDKVYQKASVSGCLASGGRMVRAGRNAKEIMIPKISVSGLGDYTRNVGYKTGSITFDYETKTFNYDRGIKLLADVMDVEEAGVLDNKLDGVRVSVAA